MLPHLLVMGTRNFYDQGPGGPCRRPSGERGGGDGPIGGEIGPLPSSKLSMTPPGLTGTNSERSKKLEEVESCPICS